MRWREGLTFLLIAELSMCLYSQATLRIEVKETQTNDFVAASGRPTRVYTAKVILPDGTHAKLSCLNGFSSGCGPIESFHPERLAPDSKQCTSKPGTGGTLFMTCTMIDLGFYDATRQKNDLIIVVPDGTAQYHIDSSW
jgi:hypothetical protein